MKSTSPTTALRVSMEKRVLNEFGSKILNEERMDRALESRKKDARTGERVSDYHVMPFHCECDDADCLETISMSTEEYRKVHSKTKNFIVTPAHVRLDLESIVSSFSTYVLVAKFFPHPKAV